MKFEEEILEKMLRYKENVSDNLSDQEQKEVDQMILGIVKEYEGIISFIDNLSQNEEFFEKFKKAFEDIRVENNDGE